MEKYKKVINSNKFKTSAPTWNEKFELPDRLYFVSDTQNYFDYIIKIHERVTDNPPIRIYENKIENGDAFKIQTQKTFVGIQDVLKTSSGHVLKTSSTRVQRNNFRLPRRLEDVLQRRLENVLKASCKTS